MSNKRELVSPGKVVSDYLDNLPKFHYLDDIAKKTKLSLWELEGLQDDLIPITPAIALKLEKLGKPAQYWLDLERQYQEDRVRLSGISPWRKVTDDPPPKDGSEFLLRNPRIAGAHILVCCKPNGRWLVSDGTEYGENEPDDEWMPIPGGEGVARSVKIYRVFPKKASDAIKAWKKIMGNK